MYLPQTQIGIPRGGGKTGGAVSVVFAQFMYFCCRGSCGDINPSNIIYRAGNVHEAQQGNLNYARNDVH